jgi:hypothetical protein
MCEKEECLRKLYGICKTNKEFNKLINEFKHKIKKENKKKIVVELKKLCDNGLTYNEIAKKLKLSSNYIYLLKKRCNIQVDKNRIRLTPKLTPSNDLSYIVGVLKGDGSVGIYEFKWKSNPKYKPFKHHIVTLGVKSEDFANSFKKSIEGIGLRVSFLKYRGYYICRFCNKCFVLWYKGLLIDDIKNILIKTDYKKEFIRGFFESEGSYFYESGLKYPYITITNSDKKLMFFVYELIKSFGFNPRFYEMSRSKTAYKQGVLFQLSIRKGGEAEQFVKLINPCIKNIPSNKWF